MATTEDLNKDLNVGMAEIRRTLKHYNLGEWKEYLIVRQPGKPGSYIILTHPSDKSDFPDRLLTLHLEQVARERLTAGA